jgi:hypothetical protein
MTRRRATLAVVLLCACASDKQTDGPSHASRGPRHRVPTEEVAAPEKVAALEPWDPYAGKQAQPAEEAKKVAEDERDYGAELLAALGTPVNCFKTRIGPDAPTEIRISVEASVVETGIVTRSDASSAQLDDSEIACVRGRLGRLRLRAPVSGAPRSVRATLELKRQAPVAKPAAADAAAGDAPENAPDKEPAEPAEAPEAVREEPPREDAPREEAPREDAPREEAPRSDDDEPRDDNPAQPPE